MATTDRMDELDSSRQVTDRMGGTVILGNAVESAPASVIAAASMSMGTKSDASVNFNMAASITGDLTNGSFGIWAVDFIGAATGLLEMDSASIAGVPFNHIAQALMTWGADGMLLNIQVFEATGTYTPTSGTAQVVVVALGGGGGGGGAESGASTTAGGGGGAGALAMGRITSGFSGVTVTVGAAGAGGAAGANDGTAGGSSSFGAVLTAGGGGGGAAGTVTGSVPRPRAGGTGGSASGSASLFGSAGQNGDSAFIFASDGGAAVAVSAGGGSTMYGSGGAGQATGGTSTANAATGFGAGGAGAARISGQSATAGANGTAGLVIVYEYNA